MNRSSWLLSLIGLAALAAGAVACASASKSGPRADSPGTARISGAALDNDTATATRPVPDPVPAQPTPTTPTPPVADPPPAPTPPTQAATPPGPPPRRRYLDHPKAPPPGPPPPEPPIRWEKDPALPDPRDVPADQVLAKYKLDDGSVVYIFHQEGKVIRRHVRGLSGGLRMVQEKAIDERPPGG